MAMPSALVTSAFRKRVDRPADEAVGSRVEHHSNILAFPWSGWSVMSMTRSSAGDDPASAFSGPSKGSHDRYRTAASMLGSSSTH